MTGGSSGPVLVTGAGGLVGRNVVARLAALGRDVVATDLRTPASLAVTRAWRDDAGVSTTWCDLTDADAVTTLLARVRPAAVVHLAAVIPPLCYQRPDVARAVNVDATRHLLTAAAALPAPPRFVHASSVAVHGARNPHRTTGLLDADTPLVPTDLYGELKADAETAVRASDLEWVVLRLGGVLSTRDEIAMSLDMIHFESLLPSDGRIQTVDVRDVARAFAAATTADVAGEVLMIGGDATHRLRQRDIGAAMAAARGITGGLGVGRPGDPDDDASWFATDWMDTDRAQEALAFQRHSWPEMLAETADRAGRSRHVARLAGPALRAVFRFTNARRGDVAPYRSPGGAA